MIKRFLTDFGIKEPAQKLDAKAVTGRKWVDFMNDLKVFILARNTCAHSGQLANPPSPSGLIADCDLIDELGLRIVELLDDHLASI